MAFYCYIVTNKQNGTLYIGSTDCLTTRIAQHKTKTIPGFTARYGCDRLVWFQTFDTREAAFCCERGMKEWRRSWKIQVIEEANPNWRDLYWEACGVGPPGHVDDFLSTLPICDPASSLPLIPQPLIPAKAGTHPRDLDA